MGGDDVAAVLPDLVWKLDLPFGDAVTGPHYLLGRAYKALGRSREAEAAFAQVQKLVQSGIQARDDLPAATDPSRPDPSPEPPPESR